ncbi:hypothetical protein SAMN05216559_1494 [Halomicrobium zhouii]|uniref:Uncharacterized protein n=1 Tax=Halomicrobium zhouii TaxID=767519 RepID=A0A1I6KSZ6_9EURY|nr:hypothetical protein [Halomicrobium zhouii]SFR94304.1 hypothetical protein SAMN05216559_1494 [Halomicrobium zhouii]
MPDTLPVHLNRESLHSLDVPTGIETDGSFDVLLVNHGEAVHVHLHLDDPLSRLATLDANNHYVQAESERPVRVTVDRGATGHGKLKVVTSYGAETRYVDVDLVEPAESEQPVQVDESLSKPQPKEPESSSGPSLADRIGSPVFLLAGVALLLAAAVVAVVQSPIVQFGSAVVFFAVLVGLFLAYAE